MSQGSQFKAMESYFHALLNESPAEAKPSAQPAPQAAPIDVPPVAYAEPAPASPARLEALLSQVEQAATPRVEVRVEAPPVAVVAPKPVRVAAPPPVVPVWKNIEPGKEFQALFFVVSGVTFAVPLTELGGIHQMGRLNTLIGKPDWFAGVMTQRETQLSVVDTTRWVMPGKEADAPYDYLVMLGSSAWGLACHQLIGTELLLQDRIQWRSSAGKRPWLAGMVKDRMCALLHVRELLQMLDKGVNIDGL